MRGARPLTARPARSLPQVRFRDNADGKPEKSDKELQALFKQLDVDGSGTVRRPSHFRTSCTPPRAFGAVRARCTAHAALRCARVCLPQVDMSEYVIWALAIAIKESKGRVLDLFKEWDDDKSGFVDVHEFHKALHGLGFACKKDDAKKVFADLDPDGSGKLVYSELNAALRRIQRRILVATAPSNPPSAKRPGSGGAKKKTPGAKK